MFVISVFVALMTPNKVKAEDAQPCYGAIIVCCDGTANQVLICQEVDKCAWISILCGVECNIQN